jgi:hypothetical protein
MKTAHHRIVLCDEYPHGKLNIHHASSSFDLIIFPEPPSVNNMNTMT